ncbi:MAG: tyrosine-type recombinase/integrase [Carboxylicivirga sp.]|jgi:integrase/recombinase XerD|nr:tyrosine-type recombinase/integrase [Carboxylicivirga sp.]
MKPIITLKPFIYKKTKLIKLIYESNNALDYGLKQLDFVHFSHLYNCFYIRQQKRTIDLLIGSTNHLAQFNIDQLRKREFAPILFKNRHFITSSMVQMSLSGKSCYLSLPYYYNASWADFLKSIGCIYEVRRRIWLVPDYKNKSVLIKQYFNQQDCQVTFTSKQDEKVVAHLRRQSLGNDKELNQFIKVMTLQGASKNTILNYTSQLQKLKVFYEGKAIVDISDEEIQDYLFFLREELSFSMSAQNIVISAIRRYLHAFTERNLDSQTVPRPKKSKVLPKTLERSEIQAILKQNINLKHKCLLYMLYATGIRGGELLNLKVEDVGFSNNIIVIKKGKGRKDRVVKLPQKLKAILQKYMQKYRPIFYLFEGQNGGSYSSTSLQKVIKGTAQKAGITKRVTPHMLRHSYATHLHDSGMDIRHIQRLLGHQSTKTTEIYTYISKRDISQLKSPLDDLEV